MTLVATWFNLEQQHRGITSIWSVADTQISSIERHLQRNLTLEGAKVFEVPVVCKKPSHPNEEYFRKSIGFAYAGNSLIGQNVHALLSTFLSNLTSFGGRMSKPDYKSIVEKARRIVLAYSRSIQDVVEVAIFGICPATDQYFIAVVSRMDTEENELIDYKVDYSTQITQTCNCIIIGDGEAKKKLDENIQTRLLSLKDKVGSEYWRIPVFELRND